MRSVVCFVAAATLACSDATQLSNAFTGLSHIPTEELRIGSPDEPETAFTWFRDAEVASDGTIFTGHPQDAQIRMHSASGQPLGTIGRKGEGPGEFDAVGWMSLVRDTLWVLDHGLYRFSWFDIDGKLLGTQRIPIDLGERNGDLPPRPRFRMADGSFGGSPPAFSHMVVSGELTESYIVRMDTAGQPVDTLATYSLVNTVWAITNNSQGQDRFGSFRAQPFGDTEIVQLSDYAPEIVRVTRGQPPADGRPVFTVMRRAVEGDTIFAREYAYEPVPLRTHMIDSIIDAFAHGVATSEFLAGRVTYAQASEWAREGLYVPAYHPPVSDLVIGADETLWLRGEELGEPTVTWRIISPSGEPMGTVELPSGFRMMYAREMQVWGSQTDELDVPYIVRYSIGAVETS